MGPGIVHQRTWFSRIVVSLLLLVFLLIYALRPGGQAKEPLKISTWDALGYYVYLPAIFIYQDLDRLQWYPAIEEQYHLQGDGFYQFSQLPDGKYTGKYFVGVSILQAPFFLIAHVLAMSLGYPADGFSFPYQFMIGVAALFYALLALLLLRALLLRFYSDYTTGITLLLAFLGTNAVQYICRDSGQSHAFLLFPYALMLWLCFRFYERPVPLLAFLIGLTIGFAGICRPTEAIILFIPLLWKEREPGQKKRMARDMRLVLPFVLGLALAASPQLLYWKYTTGSWVYDVGSKWDFLTPHLRVLWGWEKGWFIYTPLTIGFIAGLFYMKRQPFRLPVLVYCLLNIWIITAWSDWRYGGSYSCRALVQCTPVMTLPLAALLEHLHKRRWLVLVAGLYLTVTNLLQVYQYNHNILHYNDMNRAYYGAIYWNPSPTPLQYSLLDSNRLPPRGSVIQTVYHTMDTLSLNEANPVSLPVAVPQRPVKGYLLECKVLAESDAWNGCLYISAGEAVQRLRVSRPMYRKGQYNAYAVFIPVIQPQGLAIRAVAFEGKITGIRLKAVY